MVDGGKRGERRCCCTGVSDTKVSVRGFIFGEGERETFIEGKNDEGNSVNSTCSMGMSGIKLMTEDGLAGNDCGCFCCCSFDCLSRILIRL
jgi:hypothetical protein